MTPKAEAVLEKLGVYRWWVCLLLAWCVFVLLRYLLPVLAESQNGTWHTAAFRNAARWGYLLAPYLAIALLVPAPFNLVRAWQRKHTLHKQEGLDSIRALDRKNLARQLGEAFRRQGYLVAEPSLWDRAEGIDLRLRKGSEIFLVQCKHWLAQKISSSTVQRLHEAMRSLRAAGGFLITSGRFTDDAKALAADRRIELVDGARLEKMIASVHKAMHSPALAATAIAGMPECPRCKSPMVKRSAKLGGDVSSEFWSCSRFPDCHGARPMN
jgi:restriction system protein